MQWPSSFVAEFCKTLFGPPLVGVTGGLWHSCLMTNDLGGGSLPQGHSFPAGGGHPAEFASSYHDPVLMDAVRQHLSPASGRLLVDGTVGGGGHSEALLKAGATVIGVDQDPEARAFATTRLGSYGDRFQLLAGNFRRLGDLLKTAGYARVDGILVDIGVSSHQLDDAGRGFSFQADGPLNMLMNPVEGQTAADLVNEESEQELSRIFHEYGEEPQARRLARGLVERRRTTRFETTGQLAAFIEELAPRRGRKHPATRVFQALRIAVNDELGALADFLEAAPKLLNPGGRLVVISFHSLEDRMVKQAFSRLSTEWLDRPEWPAPRKNPEHCLRLLTRKPVEATESESQRNPRARSARLRAAERIAL